MKETKTNEYLCLHLLTSAWNRANIVIYVHISLKYKQKVLLIMIMFDAFELRYILCLGTSSSVAKTLGPSTRVSFVVCRVRTFFDSVKIMLDSHHAHTHTHIQQNARNIKAFKIVWIIILVDRNALPYSLGSLAPHAFDILAQKSKKQRHTTKQ